MSSKTTDEDRKRAREWGESKSNLALLIAEVRRETAEEIAREIEADLSADDYDDWHEGANAGLRRGAAIARRHAKRGES